VTIILPGEVPVMGPVLAVLGAGVSRGFIYLDPGRHHVTFVMLHTVMIDQITEFFIIIEFDEDFLYSEKESNKETNWNLLGLTLCGSSNYLRALATSSIGAVQRYPSHAGSTVGVSNNDSPHKV
jgi:hypothetical protein